MAISKSPKLQAEEKAIETESEQNYQQIVDSAAVESQSDEPIQIREVKCCNDFIAILQFQINTKVAMIDSDSTYKNEGMIVGVGPGISDNSGGRLKPTVKIGDVVMFGGRNIAAQVESSSPPYVGKKVIIVSERNILCQLPKHIEFELLKED